MKAFRKWCQKHPIVVFFLLTFIVAPLSLIVGACIGIKDMLIEMGYEYVECKRVYDELKINKLLEKQRI